MMIDCCESKLAQLRMPINNFFLFKTIFLLLKKIIHVRSKNIDQKSEKKIADKKIEREQKEKRNIFNNNPTRDQ